MSDHDQFEQLCALAATGDLSSEEFGQLQEHLHNCLLCRAAYRDYHALLHAGLPAMAPQPRMTWLRGAAGLKKRFLERAGKEGISVGEPRRIRITSWRFAAVAAGLALAAYAGYSWRGRPVPSIAGTNAPSQVRALETLSGRVAELERLLSEKPAAAPAQPAIGVPGLARERELTDELGRQRTSYETALAEKARLEQTVAALSSQLEQLRGEMQAARAETDRVRGSLRETQSALERESQELAPLRTDRANDTRTIAEQRSRLEDLSARLNEQTETLQRERELLAAGKDIRDLMGARNLHVVDVVDDGAPGRKRAIPGRIFYTEGKSLIFYAYDLENRGRPQNVAFQVWGKKEGRSQPARSLGILYQDDAAQKRWVLKFENPAVLAQIDQVFVTVERPGGNHQPTGKQLLFAALTQNPNHP